MANLSSSWGYVYLSDFTGDNPEKLWEALNNAQRGREYNFYLQDLDNDEASFFGTGRWTFETNMERFGRWFSEPPEVSEGDPYYQEVVEALDYLKATGWRLNFDFYDVECGCHVAYDAEWGITHEAGAPLETTTSEMASHNDYEYSLPSLVTNMAMDIDEALQEVTGYCVEEIDEETLREQLYLTERDGSLSPNEKGRIVSYLEELLEEVQGTDYLGMMNGYYNQNNNTICFDFKNNGSTFWELWKNFTDSAFSKAISYAQKSVKERFPNKDIPVDTIRIIVPVYPEYLPAVHTDLIEIRFVASEQPMLYLGHYHVKLDQERNLKEKAIEILKKNSQ